VVQDREHAPCANPLPQRGQGRGVRQEQSAQHVKPAQADQHLPRPHQLLIAGLFHQSHRNFQRQDLDEDLLCCCLQSPLPDRYVTR
jgi:hypothetical protein